MIIPYDMIDTMVALEAKCTESADKYSKVFYAVGKAVDNGQTLSNIIDANTYGMLREYMPDFDIICTTIYTTISNALQVLTIWENHQADNDASEEAANAYRTLEALFKEFNDAVKQFNALANTINTHTEIAYKTLSDMGYIN